MKTLLLASASAIAMLGLAACSDTDDTTTHAIDEPATQETAPEAAPADPADEAMPEEEAVPEDDSATQPID